MVWLVIGAIARAAVPSSDPWQAGDQTSVVAIQGGSQNLASRSRLERWKTDREDFGGKKKMRDRRFVIEHAGDPKYSQVTRASEGHMLFLAYELPRMKQGPTLGSRIAEIHTGSSPFTALDRQGESNIGRWMTENDWLQAILAVPLKSLIQHRHRCQHIRAHEPEAGAAVRQCAADRRDQIGPSAKEETREAGLRAHAGGHREDLPDDP